MKKFISYILAVTLLFCSAVAFADEKEIVIDTEVPVFKDLVDGSSYPADKEIKIADLSLVHYIVMKAVAGKTATLNVEGFEKTFSNYEEIDQDDNLDCSEEYKKIATISKAGSYMVYATDIYNHDIAVRFKITSGNSGGTGGTGGGGGGSTILVKAPYANGIHSNTKGNVIAGEKITLDTDTGNADIYYTIDGTIPTSKSQLYDDEKGVILTPGQTLKAIAMKNGISSEVSVWNGVEAPKPTPDAPQPGGSETPGVPGGSIVKDTLETEEHIVYMNGYPDSTFGPNNNMTRAEVATMFARLMKEKMNVEGTYECSFADVAPDAWYYNYIGYMEKFGIITGYEDGTFRPQNTITRAEFVTMASRFATVSEEYECTFADVTAEHWAYDYVSFAAGNGWIGGYEDNTFRADNTITRAEVVTIVNNMLVRDADKEYVDANKALLTLFGDVDELHWAYYDIIEATNEHTYTIIDTAEKWN